MKDKKTDGLSWTFLLKNVFFFGYTKASLNENPDL